MNPKILFAGLSVMIVAVIVTVFGYSEFSYIIKYLHSEAEYNTYLTMLIGGVVLLIVGLGITIYGATKKRY
jgi:hypothetical protein